MQEFEVIKIKFTFAGIREVYTRNINIISCDVTRDGRNIYNVNGSSQLYFMDYFS